MPSNDHCGYQVAVEMVLNSTHPRKHSKEYLQFDTIRQLRTSFSNFEQISSENAFKSMSVMNGTAGDGVIHQSAASSLWFKQFVSGCKSQMGQIHKSNLALSTKLIASLLISMMLEVKRSESEMGKFDLAVFGV